MKSPSSGGKRGKRRRNDTAAGPDVYPSLATAPTTAAVTRTNRSSSRSRGREDASADPESVDGDSEKQAPSLADALLVNLADACKLHQRNHHSGRQASSSSAFGCALSNHAADHSGAPQKQCQAALETLGRVIVKVEDTYRAARQPTPQHVKHICDFYSHVCNGVFCPHAPTLFHHGRQGALVMPRVHALMEHVITRSVISNQVALHVSSSPSSSATASSSDNSGPSSLVAASLHEILVQTITTLLMLIPEASIKATVVHNLVQLLVDATTVVMAYSLAKTAATPEPGSGIFMKTVPINVNLLAQTQMMESSRAAVSSPTVSGAPPMAFGIDIRSQEQAWAWQAALLGITGDILWRVHQARVTSLHQSSLAAAYDESSHISVEDLLTPSVTSKLLRVVEWTATTPCVTADKRRRALQNYSRLRSLQLLEIVLNLRHGQIWPSCCSPRQCLEVANLVAQATREHFREHRTPSHEFGSTQVAAFLKKLLTRTVLLLPVAVTGDDGIEQLRRMTCASVCPTLVDALSMTGGDPKFTDGEKSEVAWDNSQVPCLLQINDHGRLLEADDHEYTQLTNICLAILHRTVLESPALISRLMVEEELSRMPSRVDTDFHMIGDSHGKLISKVLTWIAHPVLGPQAVGLARIWLKNANVRIISEGVKSLLEAYGIDTMEINNENDASKTDTNDHQKGKKRKHTFAISLQKRPRMRNVSVSLTQAEKHTDRKTEQKLENQLSKFLVGLARPAATQLCALTRETLSSTSISDAMVVSAGIQLLLPFVAWDKCEDDCLGLAALLSLLLESMIGFCKLLMPCTNSNFTCVSICVDCGVFVSSYSTKHALLRVLAHHTKTLCIKAICSRASEDAYVQLATPLSKESALALSIVKGDSQRKSQLFEGVSLIVIWDETGMGFGSYLITDFQSVSISGDMDAQRSRVAYLAALQTGINMPASSDGIDEKQTLQRSVCTWIVDSKGHDHKDPLVRLLWWQSLAWLFLCVDIADISSIRQDVMVGQSLMSNLIALSFADPVSGVRDYAGRELGSVVCATNGVVAALLTEENAHCNNRSDEVSLETTSSNTQQSRVDTEKCDRNRVPTSITAHGQAVNAFFQTIDRLLYEHSSVPQALLSFTVGALSGKRKSGSVSNSLTEVVAYQRSALRALVSMVNLKHVSSKDLINEIFQNTFLRVLTVSGGDGSPEPIQTRGLCHGELALVRSQVEFLAPLQSCLEEVSPDIFYNLLVPCSGFEVEPSRRSIAIESIPTTRREQRHRLLCSTIQRFISERPRGDIVSVSSRVCEVLRVTDTILPCVLSQFVLEKEYDTLRLATEFKIFVMHLDREDVRIREKSIGSHVRSIGDNMSPDRTVGRIHSRRKMKKVWAANLEDETRRLCLSPHYIERILATAFIKGERSELLFLIKIVLQNTLTLPKIMESDQLILKELLWQLGRRDLCGHAVKAIWYAAHARNQDVLDMPTHGHPDLKVNRVATRDEGLVSDWMSRHFMFLLVNVIQHRWNGKTLAEKTQSLRCLSILLQHLRHSDASKYVPQIMSTVNAAIAVSKGGASQAELSLRAVEVLSEFVKLLARHHCEIIGANLVAIVVCVIPLLTPPGDKKDNIETFQLANAAHEAAIGLLEWLTQGELGRKLAPHFSEIPFLPTSDYMATVRSNLKLLGIDFDSLSLTISTENVHNIFHRQSMTSDGSINADRSERARKQEILRHRLGIMLPLIFNENASIRKVTLQHVTELLQANRDLFHFLIDNESSSSMGRYLTVAYDGRSQSQDVVGDLVEALLSRCINESDSDARLLLAACFGEVGAFDSKRLERARPRNVQSKPSHGSLRPPWRVAAAEYEIRLLNKELVLGLKAAATSSDQNKIAYTIQQLLSLLDKHRQDGAVPSSQGCLAAAVVDVIEPFRHTEFREGTDTVVSKAPPFFETSKTYKGWLADWCRHMILSSRRGKETAWVELFWACRLAVRSHAGLPVAEVLLPVLVLDRLCFGKSKDEREIINEFKSVLSFENPSHMDPADRRKAVDRVFYLFDTIEQWVEDEIERKHQKDIKKEPEDDLKDLEWPRDSSMIRIEDLIKAVPHSLRARAASNVGMHAMALRILEIATRKTCASVIFDSSQANADTLINKRSRAAGNCPEGDLNTMKDALAALSDYDTMVSLTDEHFRFDPDLRVRDSIRQKEAAGDWEGALQEYEQAQHICGPDQVLQLGSLKCLLELGHFDSVLNQVKGMVVSDSTGHPELSLLVDTNATFPFALEAAWRLGRWETLENLIEQGSKETFRDPKALYQASLGKLMLEIKRKNQMNIRQDIRAARRALMDSLSGFARESYSRAYSHLVQLQCLREIEESAELLCTSDAVYLEPHAMERNWNGRLDMLSSKGASTVIKTRLALARLAGDASMEGSLYLNLGRRARKNNLRGIAASSFALAEATLPSISIEKNAALERCSLQVQMAKLKHDYGESGRALQLLQLNDEEKLAGESIHTLQRTAYNYVKSLLPRSDGDGLSESQAIGVYCRSLLQSTRWMIEEGLKDATQIRDRFTILHSLAPKWEKGHFYYAKFIDSMLESRIEAIQRRSSDRFLGLDEEKMRNRCIREDRACHRNILMAVQHYAEALKLDIRHVYHALPRLLSLWFDFTSLELVDTSPNTLDSAARHTESQSTAALSMAQEEVNAFIAREYKLIPPRAFYTAISQLVSCVTHSSKDTEKLVRVILIRVLSKHPEQTMWLLGWLRQSQFRDRRQIGEDIFKRAEHNLLKLGGDNAHRHKVLVESKSLFKYFHDLASHKISDMSVQKLAVKPWKGAVSLMDFVPPVQAALSVSFLSATDGGYCDSFSRQVPRMRSFQKEVGVMGSKARPKKLKVFVVSADTYRSTDIPNERPRRDPVDIGEVHFLIKQEAKGDLRKDARVQDLSTVVNRLMTSSKSGNRESQSGRALRLRTYAVTCLSEDTGILEWVPDTESLRSLIAKSYNPQASPFSVKRRGYRVANFGDPMLRTNFEKKCQPLFFENGNLRRAATLFEELCLKPYPPLLYWWFVQHFSDPHAWYEARTRFILSAAIWSGIGHVIGLGDRHSENILVDTSLGECVHVDFDCIFDKGLTLPKPETVPFRLTHNMIDAFGPIGVDGVFTRSLKSTMSVLRDSHDMLLSVLEPFIKDPIIDWRRLRNQQKNQEQGAVTSERQTLEAKRSLLVIDQRLKGIYNLRNPNLKKIRRSDLRGASQQDDDLTHLVPLSVDGQVHKMIAEATSNENLVQLYVGWMPWL